MRYDRCEQRPVCQIKVVGRLDEKWSDWFGGMEIATGSSHGSPITILTGPVPDQAALRGLLTKIWDLNLEVISVLMAGLYSESADGAATREHKEGTER